MNKFNFEPVAMIGGHGHPRHLSYLQSATEARLYGAMKPLYTLDQLTEAYEAGKLDAIPEGWVLVPKEPIGWTHSCPVLCLDGVELWIDRCPHCGKPAAAPKGEE